MLASEITSTGCTLYAYQAGQRARSTVGMAGLPLDLPAEIEAELEIAHQNPI